MILRPPRLRVPQLLALVLGLVVSSAPAAAQTTDLDGAWRADRYELASGGSHDLAGHILFVEGEWNVLFYVLDDDGEPVRFSAEGGTFTRSGDDLVFTHLYYAAEGDAVEGLEAQELRVDVRDEPLVEPSRASVDGDELTLFFPSGNRMVFKRAMP